MQILNYSYRRAPASYRLKNSPQVLAPHELINDELDRGVSAEGAGVGTGLMGLFHNFLGLRTVDAGKFGVEFDSEVVAAGIVFQKLNDGAKGGIFQFFAGFFGGVFERAVVAGGISGGEEVFRIGTAA